MRYRLYVGNLARDVSVSTLPELFEPHGFVMDVKLVTGVEALGFAIVIMATDESAMAAMRALNGASLHGTVIRVEVARDARLGPGEGL